MAFLDLSSHRLHYRVDGDRGPWLTFCNSLGTDLGMWDAQAEALSGEFRVLRYDRRGHGESTAAPGPYSMADLGGDVLALLDALRIERSRSEEHTSELQSLMRISYAVFCLKKKTNYRHYNDNHIINQQPII